MRGGDQGGLLVEARGGSFLNLSEWRVARRYPRLSPNAAIQAEALVAVGGAAAFPQQLPAALVLAQHLFSVLVVDTVLQQQEVAAHVRTVFKTDMTEVGERSRSEE